MPQLTIGQMLRGQATPDVVRAALQVHPLQARAAATRLPATSPARYAERADGTAKGNGFFGPLVRPDGAVSTELSMGTSDVNGQEMDVPLLTPGLTAPEVAYLLQAPENDWAHPTMQSIARKAVAFARQRVAQGLPVFALPSEQRRDRYPELPREQE